jgi:AraC-like DNA-binding protein
MENYVRKFLDGLDDRGKVEEMFELLPDIYFYIKDHNRHWVMCNSACLRLLNFRDQSEVYGATEYDFFPPVIAEAIRLDDQDVIGNSRRIINRVELIVGETGHLTWVSTNKIPLVAKNGSIAGLMGTTRIMSRSDHLPENFQRFRKAIDHIQSGLASRIDIKELARLCALSDSQFRKSFKAQFRLSPQEFILRSRLQFAARLLVDGDTPIIDVAINSGFTDQSYFTRQFRVFFQQTPKRYRTTWGQK